MRPKEVSKEKIGYQGAYETECKGLLNRFSLHLVIRGKLGHLLCH